MHAVVVGGGISGLAAAYRLRRLLGAGAQITLVEQAGAPGGKLRTVSLAGLAYDVGAEAFLVRRPEALALVHELGLGDQLVHPGPATARVRFDGRVVALPPRTMLGVPATAEGLETVLSDAGLAMVRAEPAMPMRWDGGDVAVGPLVVQRLGAEVADRLVDPLLGGVYAGHAADLGLRPTMPALAAALDALAAAGRPPSLLSAAATALRVAAATSPSPSPSPQTRHTPAYAAPGGAETHHTPAYADSGGAETRHTPAYADSGGAETRHTRAYGGLGGAETRHTRAYGDSGGPVFGALRGGMSVLVDALVRASGAELRLGLPVRGLARTPSGWRLEIGAAPTPEYLDADGVLLAVPPPALRRLLAPLHPVASAAADGIDVASSVIVSLALPPTTRLPASSGSGVLVAAGEHLHAKAFTFSSVKWPHLASGATTTVLRASLGRHGETRTLQAGDAELVRLVRADLAELTGITTPPVDAIVTRWGGGLPQYTVGHLDRVAAIETAAASLHRLAVAGAALHGIGIPACIATADAAASQLAAALSSG